MNASTCYSSSYFAPTVSHYRAVTAMLGFVRELAADVQYSWNCATDGQPDWSVYVSFVVRPVCSMRSTRDVSFQSPTNKRSH